MTHYKKFHNNIHQSPETLDQFYHISYHPTKSSPQPHEDEISEIDSVSKRFEKCQKPTILGVLRSLPFSGCFPSVVLVRKVHSLVFKYIGVLTHFRVRIVQKTRFTGSGPRNGQKRPFFDPLFGPRFLQTGTLYD